MLSISSAAAYISNVLASLCFSAAIRSVLVSALLRSRRRRSFATGGLTGVPEAGPLAPAFHSGCVAGAPAGLRPGIQAQGNQ